MLSSLTSYVHALLDPLSNDHHQEVDVSQWGFQHRREKMKSPSPNHRHRGKEASKMSRRMNPSSMGRRMKPVKLEFDEEPDVVGDWNSDVEDDVDCSSESSKLSHSSDYSPSRARNRDQDPVERPPTIFDKVQQKLQDLEQPKTNSGSANPNSSSRRPLAQSLTVNSRPANSLRQYLAEFRAEISVVKDDHEMKKTESDEESLPEKPPRKSALRHYLELHLEQQRQQQVEEEEDEDHHSEEIELSAEFDSQEYSVEEEPDLPSFPSHNSTVPEGIRTNTNAQANTINTTANVDLMSGPNMNDMSSRTNSGMSTASDALETAVKHALEQNPELVKLRSEISKRETGIREARFMGFTDCLPQMQHTLEIKKKKEEAIILKTWKQIQEKQSQVDYQLHLLSEVNCQQYDAACNFQHHESVGKLSHHTSSHFQGNKRRRTDPESLCTTRATSSSFSTSSSSFSMAASS